MSDVFNHWVSVYHDTPALAERGIDLDTFLLTPHDYLMLIDQLDEAKPLLPAQLEAATRQAVLDGLAEMGCLPDEALARGDVYIEPLRHHAYRNSKPQPRRVHK